MFWSFGSGESQSVLFKNICDKSTNHWISICFLRSVWWPVATHSRSPRQEHGWRGAQPWRHQTIAAYWRHLGSVATIFTCTGFTISRPMQLLQDARQSSKGHQWEDLIIARRGLWRTQLYQSRVATCHARLRPSRAIECPAKLLITVASFVFNLTQVHTFLYRWKPI